MELTQTDINILAWGITIYYIIIPISILIVSIWAIIKLINYITKSQDENQT